MHTYSDDCWRPSPGSWEEAVDPYDIQRSRLDMRACDEEPSNRNAERADDVHPISAVPATL